MTATMYLNADLNGIELSFDGMPSIETRDALKANGFRWHRVKKIWYAKQTSARLELAKKISGGQTDTQSARAAHTTEREIVNKYGLKVGDILEGSWGYSMTIVEYYKVTKILSPAKIEIVEVGHTDVDENGKPCGHGMYGHVIPDPEREIGERSVKTCLKDRYYGDNACYVKHPENYCNLRPWDGRASYYNSLD